MVHTFFKLSSNHLCINLKKVPLLSYLTRLSGLCYHIRKIGKNKIKRREQIQEANMEVENISSVIDTKEEEDDVPLPGFRFHPTDEELVGFYLKRKVEKKPISIELIKQADIYKYDPWDLPKGSNVGDKEWYFFCKRGRKYRNSIRPNRVTSSGFWKATGIDRPIYSSNGDCIGLKKSLVYYRGSAGKGTKTDWMMHEFRLPPNDHKISNKHNVEPKSFADQEAEVWTLCRILKRNVSYKKCRPDWREVSAKSSKTSSLESDNYNKASYISFNAPIIRQNEKKPYLYDNGNQQYLGHFSSAAHQVAPPAAAASSFSSSVSSDFNDLLKHADWEDLRSIVDCSANPFYL